MKTRRKRDGLQVCPHSRTHPLGEVSDEVAGSVALLERLVLLLLEELCQNRERLSGEEVEAGARESRLGPRGAGLLQEGSRLASLVHLEDPKLGRTRIICRVGQQHAGWILLCRTASVGRTKVSQHRRQAEVLEEERVPANHNEVVLHVEPLDAELDRCYCARSLLLGPKSRALSKHGKHKQGGMHEPRW